MASPSRALDDVRRFQSEVSYLRDAPDPIASRITVYVILGLLVAFGAISVLCKLDRVVTSEAGRVVTLNGYIQVQALDTSLVRSINVHEGDRVEKGQVLATLDPTIAQADVSQLKQQAASLRAQIARASAELTNTPLVFAPTEDPDELHYNRMQDSLYQDRQAQYVAQLRSYDEKIAGFQATLLRLRQDIGSLRQKSDIARKVEDMRTTLLEHGSGSLLNQLDSKTTRLEAQRTEENERNSLAETDHQLSEQAAEREAFVRSWKADLRKEEVTAQNSLDGARAQLEKASLHKDLVELRAPEDAIILTVAKTSVGAVLKEGDLLYSATPLSAPLQAEVRLASRDVGFVRAGDRVTLKVDAFRFTEHGTADGVVRWISEGAFVLDPDTNQPVEPYYKARVDITKLNFINVPKNFRLIPGMTLVADINVGKRSLAGYLADGFVRGVDEAMREP